MPLLLVIKNEQLANENFSNNELIEILKKDIVFFVASKIVDKNIDRYFKGHLDTNTLISYCKVVASDIFDYLRLNRQSVFTDFFNIYEK